MRTPDLTVYYPENNTANISKEDREIINFVNNKNRKNSVNTKPKDDSADIYMSSKNSAKKSDKIKKEVAKALAAYALGALTVTGVMLPKLKTDKPADMTYVTPITVAVGSTYETLARMYDSDPRAIIAYNRELSGNSIEPGMKIDIPRLYSNLDGDISSLQSRLICDRLSSQERKELEIQLAKLMKKKNLQEAIAVTFTDGKFVYFIINNLDEAVSEQLGKIKTKNGIPVEVFERIFDIQEPERKGKKPEILKTNDNFSYMYESISKYVSSGTMFYLPVDAISTGDNIQLNY